MTIDEISALVRDVADFPKPGIVFKDITPLLADGPAFAATVAMLAERAAPFQAAGILAIESRGFIFGAAVAAALGLPLHLVRKRGKLPRPSVAVSYALEYGSDHLEMHTDAVVPGGRYLVVDDVIATGGTAAAVNKLVKRQGGEVDAMLFVIELAALSGRENLPGTRVESLIVYPDDDSPPLQPQ
jgi:adenine phosphoribosyltransferase